MKFFVSTARIWNACVRGVATVAAVVCLQVCPGFMTLGHAQMSIWDQIQGSAYGGSEAPRVTKPAPPDDLRPNPTPWRSDVMLNAMSAAIDRYQKIVDGGGWPVVPAGRMMRIGEDDPRVPALRKRLRVTGDLRGGGGSYFSSETFDDALEQGVKNFQRRNGIRVTGRVERSVYPILNTTAQERLAQLKLNYQRLQNLMHGVEDRYVLVNIPAYQLEAVDKYEVQLRHRVIVGRPERATPEVRATIKALNFFPYWRVPDSIATLDLVPRLKHEPGYLAEEGIRVYNGYNGPELDPKTVDWNSPEVAKYKFKQDPGEKNALGLLRIDMSNQYGVYMHDTPMKNLFDQQTRPFSAGCVRVQNVFDLGDWIAHFEPGWEKPGRVRETLAAGHPMELKLTRPIPVYFAYITAWAEPSGMVEFRPDIYGRDSSALQTAYQRDNDDAPPATAAAALAP